MDINPFFEEMLAQSQTRGAECTKIFDLNGQMIDISQLVLSDLDWGIMKTLLSNSSPSASINLIFAAMLFHFPDEFSYDILMIFMGSGSKKVSSMAKDMLTNLNAGFGKSERDLFIQDLILKLD